MGLQVRLRHPLGERVIELPERTVDQPAIVGRARDADVQIPSMSVSSRHVGLFIHEGRWVAQPISGAVLLNNQPLGKATLLSVGDVLQLGDGAAAPTLEIDPIGVAEGRSGPVSASRRAASSPRPSRAPAWGAPLGAPMPAPAPAPGRLPARLGPPQMPAYPKTSSQETESDRPASDGGDSDTIGWAPSPSGPTDTTFRLPKKKKTSPVVAIVAGVLSVGGLIGVVIIAHNHAHDPPPKTETVIIKAPEHTGPKALFDLNEDQAVARQQHAKNPSNSLSPTPPDSGTAAAPAAAPQSAAAGAAPPKSSSDLESPDSAANTGDGSDAWRDVVLAHGDVRHQGLSIVKFDEYRRNHPGKFSADLDRFTQDAVNWLYWQYVAQLWKQRDSLTADIKQKTMDLNGQSSPEFHAQVLKDKGELEAKYDQANTSLKGDLGYSGDTPPDLESPSNLVNLASLRDQSKFSDFERRVLKYVRAHHGSVWWDGD